MRMRGGIGGIGWDWMRGGNLTDWHGWRSWLRGSGDGWMVGWGWEGWMKGWMKLVWNVRNLAAGKSQILRFCEFCGCRRADLI